MLSKKTLVSLAKRVNYPVELAFSAPEPNKKGFSVIAHNPDEYIKIMDVVFNGNISILKVEVE